VQIGDKLTNNRKKNAMKYVLKCTIAKSTPLPDCIIDPIVLSVKAIVTKKFLDVSWIFILITLVPLIIQVFANHVEKVLEFITIWNAIFAGLKPFRGTKMNGTKASVLTAIKHGTIGLLKKTLNAEDSNRSPKKPVKARHILLNIWQNNILMNPKKYSEFFL
jgi:hypothetical protein